MTHQLSAIGYAVHNALSNDLEPITYYSNVWSFELNRHVEDKDNPKQRRPRENEIDVYSFPQSFSSTSLGFGGVGGQAFTQAQVTVVICGVSAVTYVNGRLCHKINKFNVRFWTDLQQHSISDKIQGKKHYEDD